MNCGATGVLWADCMVAPIVRFGCRIASTLSWDREPDRIPIRSLEAWRIPGHGPSSLAVDTQLKGGRFLVVSMSYAVPDSRAIRPPLPAPLRLPFRERRTGPRPLDRRL